MSKQFLPLENAPLIKQHVVALWVDALSQANQITPDLIIPDGNIELVFILNGSYKKRKLSPTSSSFLINKSVIIGIQKTILMSTPEGGLKSIGMKFNPIQFFLLFGDLGVKATNQHNSISESGHNGLIQLDKTVCQSQTKEEAIQHIEDFFVNYKPYGSICTPLQITENCLEHIKNMKGEVVLKDFTKLGMIDETELSTYFKSFTGVTPQEMTDIVKTNNNYSDSSTNTPEQFLSTKDLFNDLDRSEFSNKPL